MKKRPSTLNHLTAALLVESLLNGPSSVYDVSDETGVSYCTTRRYIKALRDRRCIHVAEWHTDTRGRHTVRAYKMGRKADAARPLATTHARRQEMYRERARVVQEALARMTAGRDVPGAKLGDDDKRLEIAP